MSENISQSSNIQSISKDLWERLGKKKIYFGHQSVGYNILNGIKDLMMENPLIGLNIVETHEAADFGIPIFAHSAIGQNAYPQSKIDAFTETLQNGIGEKTDIAFFKFCYLDLNAGTAAEDVFDLYKNRLSDLHEQFPHVKFIHFTAPLTSQQTGPKAWVKTILRKPLRGYDDNIVRNQYNDLLRAEYQNKEPIFDLAQIESTFPDGKQASFTKDGMAYYTLVPEYTDDGSHLNEVGRKVIAEQFLLFLANTVE